MKSLSIILLVSTFFISLWALTPEILKQADVFRENHQYEKELEELKQLQSENPDDVEVYWRLARVYFDLADASEDKEIKKKYYYPGFEAAKKALEIDAESARANHWYAVLIGKIGEMEGTKQKITNSYDVRKYALKAIQLDPEYDGTYHVMGRWHYEISDLSWFERKIAGLIYEKVPEASFDEAISYFEAAIATKPDEIRHHLWLGKTYMKTKQNTKAENSFQKVLELEAQDAADRIMKKEAEGLLKKVK